MDTLDREILDLLQTDGRLPNLELAHRVGLSASPCLRRVRRLEDERIIVGYRAVIDPRAVGRSFDVLVYIDLSPIDESTITAFESAVQDVEDIVECHRMVSKPDYLLRVAVADLAAYERSYITHLATLPAVSRITSQIAMKTVKPGGRLPIKPNERRNK
ncbi:Lrp/AsnC family transcriptional regulator [Pseudonocardia spinosispora]|uniref:Lrp/AsnC family transcriptional regulator n=1 Tax=Pseudonocardia spinosispora TaxID=103441 RepID=UPI000490EB18|nr:Lrp/AsnC family transcriptional regulator [Pseudonocardia spinosispora]